MTVAVAPIIAAMRGSERCGRSMERMIRDRTAEEKSGERDGVTAVTFIGAGATD
jgi:hypothetical protein